MLSAIQHKSIRTRSSQEGSPAPRSQNHVVRIYYGDEMRGACLHHWFSSSSFKTNAAHAARDNLVLVFPSPIYPATYSLDSFSVRSGTRAMVHMTSRSAARMFLPMATTSDVDVDDAYDGDATNGNDAK